MTKSISFMQKLNQKLDNSILEDLNILMDLAGSLDSFQSQTEMEKYLSEGSLLNISQISSRALSLPQGEYMVWAIDPKSTMLVPTGNKSRDIDVFENKPTKISTSRLMENWRLIQKAILEDEETSYDSDEEDNGNEEDNGENENNEFQSKIDMSTVDRTPIARAMHQHGYTVTSLANAVDVDPPTISRIMRVPKKTQGDPGGRNPSIGLAASIANVLKLDAEALFPDIFGVPKQDLKARDQPSNKGSGMNQAASGSMKKGNASKTWTQGNN